MEAPRLTPDELRFWRAEVDRARAINNTRIREVPIDVFEKALAAAERSAVIAGDVETSGYAQIGGSMLDLHGRHGDAGKETTAQAVDRYFSDARAVARAALAAMPAVKGGGTEEVLRRLHKAVSGEARTSAEITNDVRNILSAAKDLPPQPADRWDEAIKEADALCDLCVVDYAGLRSHDDFKGYASDAMNRFCKAMEIVRALSPSPSMEQGS